MIEFLLLCIALTLLAWLFVVWPLLRQRSLGGSRRLENVLTYKNRLAELDEELAQGQLDAQTHQALVTELKANLAADEAGVDAGAAAVVPATWRFGWAAVLAAMLLVPLMAAWGYQRYGALPALLVAEEAGVLAESVVDPARVLSLRDRLLRQLEREPDNSAYLYLLGHTQLELEDYPGAVAAFTRLQQVAGDAENVLLSLVQARFMASQGQVDAETRAIMERILRRHPHQSLVLEMLALDAFHRQDYQGAVAYLEQALRGMHSRARMAALAEALIVARRAAGVDAGAPLPRPEQPASGFGIRVQVSLDPAVPVASAAKVFIIARDPSEPQVPIAVQALDPGELPASLVLTDRQAMQATRPLSQFPQVEVVARLAQQGTPTRQPGDLETNGGVVPTWDGALELVIQP